MFKKESLPGNEPPVRPLDEIRMKVLPLGFDSRRHYFVPDIAVLIRPIAKLPKAVAEALAQSVRRNAEPFVQPPTGSDSPEVPN